MLNMSEECVSLLRSTEEDENYAASRNPNSTEQMHLHYENEVYCDTIHGEECVSLLHSECISKEDENNASSLTLNSTEEVLLRYENETYSDTVNSECSANTRSTHGDLSTVNNSDNHGNVKLQDGKEVHFFASYCSEDKWRVVPMIENLEKDYNVRCFFDERDFQAGMQIHENIKRAMEKSMKMLVFLSENYVKSNFCKYEIEQAFLMSMETEVNNVIPVLLEECEIPSTIKPLTYIDATSYEVYSDVSARIIEAFNRKETASSDAERVNRAMENGYFIDLVCEERGPMYCSGFITEEQYLTSYTRQAIEAAQFNVPIETFEKAVGIVNSFRMRKRWSRYHKCRRTGIGCCFLGLVWSTLLILYAVLGLTLYSRNVSQTTMDVHKLWFSGPSVLTILVLPFLLSMLIQLYYKYRQRRDLTTLRSRIYQEVTMENYKQGALFRIICRGTCCHIYTTLRVTRYNVHPCLKFLSKRIKELVEKILKKTVESSEIFDTFADNLLRRELLSMVSDPADDAPIIRHPVKGGKSCFCQRLEPFVNDTFIAPICEMFFDD